LGAETAIVLVLVLVLEMRPQKEKFEDEDEEDGIPPVSGQALRIRAGERKQTSNAPLQWEMRKRIGTGVEMV